ncbi:hypothetical protein BRADO2198 [Bradyrhizobium sp. ORS 278]|nr:hypothetical protein BRADO2198 [Bradyrhizobium sp. ORS 278]
MKTSDQCVDVDWSVYIPLYKLPWLLPVVKQLIGRDRAERVRSMSGKAIFHNLKHGIPFQDNSADAVYHSHLMEHIDRGHVAGFTKEIFRVLKSGGILRICVPDLELLVNRYVTSLTNADLSSEASSRHDDTVAAMHEHSVRLTPGGSRSHSPFRRRQGWVLGDARARGETHLWMWDRVNIRAALLDAGFVDICSRNWNVSDIEGWERMGLERAADGGEYKPGSLYVECRKPLQT